MKRIFFILTILCSFQSIVFAAQANKQVYKTKSEVSFFKYFLKGKTPNELHGELNNLRKKKKKYDKKFKRVHKRFQKMRRHEQYNENDTALKQLHSSLYEKIIPNYPDVVTASKKFKVPEEAIIAAILTENTLATNFKDTIQSGVSNIWSHFSGAFSDFEKDLNECKEQGRCEKCKGKNLAEELLCAIPYVGEPQIPGIGRSYGPAQIDMLSSLSVADREGVYDGVFSGKKIDGVFGPRPETLAETMSDLYTQLRSVTGAINLVTATQAMAIKYYKSIGWDISENIPVLVTLYHIGKIPKHAKEAKNASKGYYPGADGFGIYSYLLKNSGILEKVMNGEYDKVSEKDLMKKLKKIWPKVKRR